MTSENAAVAILNTHADAEHAVEELKAAGFNLKKLSIVGKDWHTEERVIGYYNAGDRMQYWGKMGAFWGGIWGLLVGSAFLIVPGFGPLIIAGPLVSAIVAGLEGAVVVGGLSALGAGLYSLGIPKNSVLKYETAIKGDRFLLLMRGTAEELNQAKEILRRIGYQTDLHSQAEPVEVHD